MKTVILISDRSAKRVILCPKCSNEMDEIQLSRQDLALKNATFGFLKAERFLCYGCLWEERRIRKPVKRQHHV